MKWIGLMTVLMVLGLLFLSACESPTKSGIGTLIIQSQPSSAQIWISDTLAGITPDTLTNFPTGHWTIRLVKQDYLPLNFSVEVKDDEVTNTNKTLTSAPPYTIYFIRHDSLLSVGMDGMNVQFFDSCNYNTSLSASHNGDYLAYTKYGVVTIREINGNYQTVSSLNSMEYNWSHDDNYLAVGDYLDGIYTIDVPEGITTKVLDTSGNKYDHCATYYLDDSKIAYIHQEYGATQTWFKLMNASGGNVQTLYHYYAASCVHDENLDLNWLTPNQILYKRGYYGIYLLTMGTVDTTEQELVHEYWVRHLMVSPNLQYYAYNTFAYPDCKLCYGETFEWQTAQLSNMDIRGIAWSPDSDALAALCYDGVYWIALNGNVTTIVKWPKQEFEYLSWDRSICVAP